MLASFKWQTLAVDTAKYPLLTSDRPVIMSNGLIQQDAHVTPDLPAASIHRDEERGYIRNISRDEPE
jgi:hypothetical protein